MIRTILYGIYFLLALILSFFILIPFYFLKIIRARKSAENYMKNMSSLYSRNLLWTGGVKVFVTGLENLPEQGSRMTIIANHQSSTDIPILRGFIPIMAGFIAKKELSYIPFIRTWLYAVGCIMIKRGSRQSAVEAIEKGVASIKEGKPLIIFPEGTRGKNGVMGIFKKGALKLAVRSESLIIPVTIDGSFRIWEERYRITPTIVNLTVHPVVNTMQLSKDEISLLSDTLWTTISTGLKKDK